MDEDKAKALISSIVDTKLKDLRQDLEQQIKTVETNLSKEIKERKSDVAITASRLQLKIKSELDFSRQEINTRLGEVEKRLSKLEDEIQSSDEEEKSGDSDIKKMTRAITRTFKRIHLPSSQPMMEPPTYDHLQKPAEVYFQELENYFKLLGHRDFLVALPLVLNRAHSVWYAHNRETIKTWEDFKSKFKEAYDGIHQSSERIHDLKFREQDLTEATDKFIYEKVVQSKNIFPDKEEAFHVLHAQTTLHLRLRRAVGVTQFKTVKDLISACEQMTTILREEDRRSGIVNNVPPMYEHEIGQPRKDNKRAEPGSSRDYFESAIGVEENQDGEDEEEDEDYSQSYEDSYRDCGEASGSNWGQEDYEEEYEEDYDAQEEEDDYTEAAYCKRCWRQGHSWEDCSFTATTMECIWKDGKWVPKDN